MSDDPKADAPGNMGETPSAPADRFAFLDRLGAAIDEKPARAAPQPNPRTPAPGTRQTASQHARLRDAMQVVSGSPRALAPQIESSDGSPKAVFTLLVVAVTLLAPLPVGSNRPLLWAILAFLIGLIGASYTLVALWRMPETPLRLGRMGPLLLLALLQPLWGAIQVVPLGPLAQVLALPVDLPAALHPLTISLDPDGSKIGVLRLVGHVAFFALALDLMSRPERLLRVMRWLLIGIVVWAAYGMAALAILGDVGPWGTKQDYLGFATGPFVNRNSFAAFLGMGLVIGVALLMELRNRPKMRRQRRHGFLTEDGLRVLVHAMALVILFMTLLATGSRMGLMASLIAVGVTFGVMRLGRPGEAVAQSGRDVIGMIVAGLLAALALGAVVSTFGGSTVERALFAEQDFHTRLQIYRTALGLIADRPLLGFGLDAFPLAFELGRPDSFLSANTFADAHSSYLENWVDSGLIFGSVPIVVAVLYARSLVLALRERGRHIAASAAAAGVLALAAAHSLVDFPFEIESNVLMLCLICAMGVSRLRGRGNAQG
jgi:O-antigen ligase